MSEYRSEHHIEIHIVVTGSGENTGLAIQMTNVSCPFDDHLAIETALGCLMMSCHSLLKMCARAKEDTMHYPMWAGRESCVNAKNSSPSTFVCTQIPKAAPQQSLRCRFFIFGLIVAHRFALFCIAALTLFVKEVGIAAEGSLRSQQTRER